MSRNACVADAMRGYRPRRGRARVGWAVLLVLLGAFGSLNAAASPLSAAERASRKANSADRMIIWTACHHVVNMSDAKLDEWKRRGADGFVCQVQYLEGLGSANRFTGDVGALDGARFEFERTIRDSRIVERAASRGMDLYLGFYVTNRSNTETPFVEWFDDAGWTQTVVPAVQGLAGAAHALGFKGLAVDQELYVQDGGVNTATWEWDYPGRTRTEEEVRYAATLRGAQLMRAMLDGFPRLELLAYATYLPETWDELIQEEVNDKRDAFVPSVQLDFWNGLTSVEGYRAIRMLNATFYKTPHIGTWDTAYGYHYNNLYAMLSRRLSNWDYASSRIYESPFVWVSEGTTDFEEAKSPEYVAEQLDAARRWGMGRLFADYAYGDPNSFDYTGYEAAMRASSKPGVVDDERPQLEVGEPSAVARGEVDLTGTALDDHAVRRVRWRTDTGSTGVARMTWEPAVGNPLSGPRGQMQWEARSIPVGDGARSVSVTVEDIKGLTRTREVAIRG